MGKSKIVVYLRETKNLVLGFRVASSRGDLNCNRAPQVQGRAEGHIHFSLLWRRAWIVERRDSHYRLETLDLPAAFSLAALILITLFSARCCARTRTLYMNMQAAGGVWCRAHVARALAHFWYGVSRVCVCAHFLFGQGAAPTYIPDGTWANCFPWQAISHFNGTGLQGEEETRFLNQFPCSGGASALLHNFMTLYWNFHHIKSSKLLLGFYCLFIWDCVP